MPFAASCVGIESSELIVSDDVSAGKLCEGCVSYSIPFSSSRALRASRSFWSDLNIANTLTCPTLAPFNGYVLGMITGMITLKDITNSWSEVSAKRRIFVAFFSAVMSLPE